MKNHAKDLLALDFFTVPTATFRVLFVLVMLTHGRRRLVHLNVTEHPTAEWTARQLLEACALEEALRYLIRDRDQIYGERFSRQAQTLGIQEAVIRRIFPHKTLFDTAARMFSASIPIKLEFPVAMPCQLPAPAWLARPCAFHLFVRSAHAARRRYS